MRRALVVAAIMAGCWSRKPSASHTPSAPPPPATAPAGPHVFPPATDDLAVIHAGRALVDARRGRVFVRRERTIEIFELATGRPAGTVDIGWSGDMWPAATRLITFHTPAAHAVEATLVDPVTARRAATCARTIQAPAGSEISRVDAFTYRGQSYLKWETSPPPEAHGGARMTDAEMDAWAQRFRAAYACGLLAAHVEGATCRLDEVSYQAADLEACETRSMPPIQVPPSTFIGDIEYAIEESRGLGAGAYVVTSTLIVRDKATHAERWRTIADERQQLPPPP